MIDVVTQIEIMADVNDVKLDTYDGGYSHKYEFILRADEASLSITRHSGGVNDFYMVKLISKSITKRSTITDTEKLLTHVDMFCKKFGNEG